MACSISGIDGSFFPAIHAHILCKVLPQRPLALCYAMVLPGRKSGFRAGFRPDSSRDSFKIGPPAGRRPIGRPISGPEAPLRNIGCVFFFLCVFYYIERTTTATFARGSGQLYTAGRQGGQTVVSFRPARGSALLAPPPVRWRAWLRRLVSGRNPARKADFRPGGIIVQPAAILAQASVAFLARGFGAVGHLRPPPRSQPHGLRPQLLCVGAGVRREGPSFNVLANDIDVIVALVV